MNVVFFKGFWGFLDAIKPGFKVQIPTDSTCLMQALFIIKKLIAFSVIEFQYAFKTIELSNRNANS